MASAEVALTAARLGSTDRSKPAAPPRAVPRLRTLPTRKHIPRQRRSAAEARAARGAATSVSIDCAVAASSCAKSPMKTIASSLRSGDATDAIASTNRSAGRI